MSGLVGIGRLKKEVNRIDLQGNIIDTKTQEIVGNVEDKGYTPTKEDIAILSAKTGGEQKLSKEERLNPTVPVEPKSPLNIEDMISKKIEAIIEKKIADVLERMLKWRCCLQIDYMLGLVNAEHKR